MDQRVQLSGHGRIMLRRCRRAVNAAMPRYTAHRPMPVISHYPAEPPNSAAAAVIAMARKVPASGEYRNAVVTVALARPMISSGALAW